MKRRILVCAGVAALCGLCVLAAAQVALHKDSARALSTPWPGGAWSNLVVIPSLRSNMLFLSPVPGRKAAVTILTTRPGTNPPAALPTIAPGVYKTVPYSCIVVVPGPCPDDRCIFGKGGGESSMPVIKPDLRLIPWSPAK